MAAYDFPDTAGKPTDGSFNYTAPDGTLYEWNGYAWEVPGGSGGSSGGGDFDIPTQALPPQVAEDGDLWWCTDDGRLYIYYEDVDTSQWVDASPDNTSEAVDSYWAKSGSTLSPIDTTDSVDIGSGNISLNADGSAALSGIAQVSRDAPGDSSVVSLNAIQGGVSKGYLRYRTIGDFLLTPTGSVSDTLFGVDVDGNVRICSGAGNYPTAPNITLNTDGSAKFAGPVRTVRGASGDLCFAAYTGDTTTSATVAINSDGSAEFAGKINVNGTWPANNSSEIRAGAFYGRNDNPNETAFEFYSGGVASSDRKIKFKADGSATFASNIELANTSGGVNGSGIALTASIGQIDVQKASGSSGYFYTGSIYNGTSFDQMFGVDYNGNATFAGFVKSGQNFDNVYLKAGKGDGTSPSELTISAKPGSEINNNVLKINTFSDSDTDKKEVFAVTYAGDVTASGTLGFLLEADDDTKYTATTDAEGNETRVYNGAVLDVKERIQNVIARMDAIEANEVTDDATDSALLTLVASLSSRLDERDATIAALTTRISTLEIQSNGGNS